MVEISPGTPSVFGERGVGKFPLGRGATVGIVGAIGLCTCTDGLGSTITSLSQCICLLFNCTTW